MRMWGGCCCDFDLVGVLCGVCKICNYYILLLIFLCVPCLDFLYIHITHYQTYILDRMALELALIRVMCNNNNCHIIDID